jgi:hypothetical protein
MMKFIENTRDIIFFEANAAERYALLQFIEASIRDFDTYTIDISNFGTSKKALEEMHRVISDQLGNDNLVQMSTYLFGQMGLVAGAWQTFGFEHVLPEDHDLLEADKNTVYEVRGMFNKCFKYTFKINSDKDSIHLELGRGVLDNAIRIATYIKNNFDASDFFTIGNTRYHVLTHFLETLQNAHGRMKPEAFKVLLSLKRDMSGNFDNDQYHILERVLWYGSNFGDDIPELEPFHDDMWDIYHACFP